MRRPPARASARAIVVGFALLAITAGSASAALFPDDEARQRIDETNQRLSDLQQRIDGRLSAIEQQLKGGGLADLANQMQLLQADIAKLRGQIEVINYELDQAQKRQRDLYIDLDTRVRKLEAAAAGNAGAAAGESPAGAPGSAAAVPGGPAGVPTAPSAVPSAAAGGAPPGAMPPHPPGPTASAPVVGSAAPSRGAADVAAEQRAYDSALDKFKRGEYQSAITAFGSFVKTWPKSSLAPSAQYWLGNAQYARRDYRASIATQRRLLLDWPQSGKAPEALLNIALAQSDMGDNTAARKSLEALIRKYPKSDAAAKARERLGVR